MIQKCHRFVFALLLLTPFALAAAVVPASLSAVDSALQQQTLFFEQQIRPLLISRCYSCHSGKAAKSEGGLLLDSRKGCVDGGDSGPAVVPESLDESLLIRAVRGSAGDWQMPPGRPLSEREISLLEQWIRMGAPDPRDAPQSDRQWVDDPSDPIAGREHWAFRPLNHSSPFQNAPTDWPRCRRP